MKYRGLYFFLLTVLLCSCIKEQPELIQSQDYAPVFYASIEDIGIPDTRVYADEQLRVLWNADDRISVFNRLTYNREYFFEGQDGDNSGSFDKVPSDKLITGNALDFIYAVYPYQNSTSITNDGEITVYLPAEQSYRDNSFGLGANTMIAITAEDELVFKNLCGYFAVKLYGDNVTVKAITLRGNNNELIAGKASVVAAMDTVPTLTFDAAAASKDITLTCPTPVTLGTTPESATAFWFVIPPTAFESGFTLTIRAVSGVFSKTAQAPLEIKRNTKKNSAALEVIPIPSEDPIPFVNADIKEKLVAAFDTNLDGELSFAEAAAVTAIPGDVFGNQEPQLDDPQSAYSVSFDEFQFFTGITEVPDSLFYDWQALSTVKLPSSVQTIGNYAFYQCRNLGSIHFPQSLRAIKSMAFHACNKLTGVYIDDLNSWLSIQYTSYRSNPCQYAKHLYLDGEEVTRITIPDGFTSVGNYQFKGLSNLAEVVIPDSVTEIGVEAFYNCASLSSISLPDGVTGIGNGAFSGCSGLTSFRVPSAVVSIGPTTFIYCSELYSVSIPSSVTSIGFQAFYGCNKLSEVHISDWDAWCSIQFETEYSNPMFYAKHLFLNGVEVSRLELPEGSTVIPNRFFADNTDIISFVVPDTVTRIEDYAFAGCSELTSITIPSSVKSIGTQAFYGCEKLASVYVKNWNAWMGVDFANAASNPMLYASHLFLNGGEVNYTNLYVQSLQGAQEIKTALFAGCKNLTSIVIPDSVIRIGADSFSGCENLSSITIPESVTEIGSAAFSGCKSIHTVSISSLESWCEISFADVYSNPLCAGTTLFASGARLFVDGEGIDHLIIPAGVTEIRPYAFYGFGGLLSLTIPSWVEAIGTNAFANCRSLSSVRVLAVTPLAIGRDCFRLMNGGFPIYVPAASVDAYKAASNWSDYADWIQAPDPVPEAVDLGLSVKWASFNLGASHPEESGRYYAWGELVSQTSSYSSYKWSTSYSGGSDGYTLNTITKYNTDSSYGTVDNKTTLDPLDDIAHVSLEGSWRMPTSAEIQELIDNCTVVRTSVNGVSGRRFTSKKAGFTNKSIFLPNAGYRENYSSYTSDFNGGYYWSSSLNPGNPQCAYDMYFGSGIVQRNDNHRMRKLTIRPVYSPGAGSIQPGHDSGSSLNL